MSDLSPTAVDPNEQPDPEPRRARRRDRSESTTVAPSTVRLIPALTSFDLLEGEFNKSRTGRLTLLAAFALTALAIMLLVASGLTSRIRATSVDSAIVTERDQIELLNNQLQASGQVSGLTTSRAADFVQERADLAARLTYAEMNYAVVSQRIYLSAPAGMDVVSIVYSTEPTPPLANTGQVRCPASDAVVDLSSGTEDPASPLGQNVFVTITALHTGDVSYDAWVTSLAALPELDNVADQERGAPPEFRVTISAELAPHAHSDRSISFQADSPSAEEINPCFDDSLTQSIAELVPSPVLDPVVLDPDNETVDPSPDLQSDGSGVVDSGIDPDAISEGEG